MMRIDPRQLPIDLLFQDHRAFKVPQHQRGYAWTEESIDDFIGDIYRCLKARKTGTEKAHFFGSVITIAQTDLHTNRSNFEVIDGQQRLASFVMLVAALVLKMREIVDELAEQDKLSNEEEDAKNYFENRIEHLRKNYLTYSDIDHGQRTEIPKMILSNADNEFFQEITAGRNPSPTRASHRLILIAWEKLVLFVATKVFQGDSLEEKIDHLKKLITGVLQNDCSVISMRSHERSSAYQLFLVLNDRGEDLTSGDLLRAHTMGRLDGPSLQKTQDKVAEYWDRTLAYPRNDIENYLRWYYSSYQGNRPNNENLVKRFLENRFQCKEETIVDATKAHEILTEVQRLNEECLNLSKLGSGEWPFDSNNKRLKKWDRNRLNMLVVHLKHTNVMPLLLALRALGQIKFATGVALLERFVFRYRIIGDAHIGPATTVYMKHAKKIRDDTANYSLEKLRSELTQLIDDKVPDNIFGAHLDRLTYEPDSDNSYIRYFLITIEDYKKWFERGAKDTPECKTKIHVLDFADATIEHVYPQNVRGKGRNAGCEKIKHRIGNLTILGPGDNSEMSNRPFAEKREHLKQSNISLNRDIGGIPKWGVKEINKRQEDLINMALKVFVP